MNMEELIEMARRGELEVSSLPLKAGVYHCGTDIHADTITPALYVMFFCQFDKDDIEIFEFWTACEECHDTVMGAGDDVIR